MSTARAVLGNTFVQILGKVVTAVISIAIIKLITVYLGRAGYGEYTTIYEFLAFFGIAADFGIFQIAVREMSRFPEKRAAIFGNILSLRVILTTISMLVAAGLVWLIPQYSGTVIPAGVAIAAITTFFTLLTGTLSSALQVALEMQKAVIAQISGKVISFGYMLWIIFYAFKLDPAMGFYQLLVAGIAGNGVMLLLTYFFAKRIVPVRLQFDFAFWREIIAKALPYGTAIILATIYFRIDVILLSLLKNSEEVGVYGVAMRIIENLQMVPVFFMNSALPVMTRLLADNREKLRLLIQYSFDFLLMLGVPLVVGGIVLAYPLIVVVSSPEFISDLSIGFYGSDIALQILLIAMLLAFISNLFGYALLAGNQQIKLLYISAGAAVFNILANIVVIPTWGFRGAALTSVVSELIVIVAGFYLVRQLTGVKLKIKTTAKILLAAGIMGATVWYLQPVTYELWQNKNLLILIPAGAAIYGLILLATQAVTPEMWSLLKRRA
jgi:O-antigen/teichoic acid export membrane protein